MDFGIAETGIARGSPPGTTTEVLRFGIPFAEIRVVSAARPNALAHRAACHTVCRAVRRRLLRLRRASGCLGSSCGSSRHSSWTTPPTPRVWVPRLVERLVSPLVVDYYAYAARPGASARRAARLATRRRLLRLRRASGCLGLSRGSSRHSSSTTPPTPHDRVPRHVAQLVSPLVVDYFAYIARPGASTHRVACHAARRRLLRAPQLGLAATLALLQPHCALRLLVSWQHWL
jgi:hypothetical protein